VLLAAARVDWALRAVAVRRRVAADFLPAALRWALVVVRRRVAAAFVPVALALRWALASLRLRVAAAFLAAARLCVGVCSAISMNLSFSGNQFRWT